MIDYIFDAPRQPSLSVIGTDHRFAVRRIFCVGRNYAAHAAEMGNDVDREAPFYFTKSAHALLQSGQNMPYPQGTTELHHEVELVIAIGAAATGIDTGVALQAVHSYGVGLDMTRRDLQAAAKDKRRPWDTGKDFEASAIIAPLTCAAEAFLDGQHIRLDVNDKTRQDAPLSDMIWSVSEIIAHLSTLYHLRPGDLIMTGTPAGVGAVTKGDRLLGQIGNLSPVMTTIV